MNSNDQVESVSQGLGMADETIGEFLKRERELRQISLEEIAEETKVSMGRLRALEANQFDQLPAPIYIRGFVRIYAEYIGLDPAEVMMRFEDELFFDEQETQTRSSGFKTLDEERVESKRRLFVVLAIILVAALLVAGGLYYYFDQQSRQNTVLEELNMPAGSNVQESSGLAGGLKGDNILPGTGNERSVPEKVGD